MFKAHRALGQVDQAWKTQRCWASATASLQLPQDLCVSHLPQQPWGGFFVYPELLVQLGRQVRRAEDGLGENGVKHMHRVLRVRGSLQTLVLPNGLGS